MASKRYVLLVGVILCVFALVAEAQSVISAKSGLVNLADGKVLIDGKQVAVKPGIVPQLKDTQSLETGDGRAEVLLTPGVVLRLAENSSIRMLDTRLTDSRVELTSGSAIIEATMLLKDNSVTLIKDKASISIVKSGLYRLESEPARVRVFEGEALVQVGAEMVPVKKARELLLSGVLVAEKFDPRTGGDAFARWSKRRAERLAMANLSSAADIWRASGSNYNSFNSFGRNVWAWNAFYGLYTFVPLNGSSSYYGYRYWSPNDVYAAYYSPRYSSRNAGAGTSSQSSSYTTVPHTSSGHSGVVASTGAPTAPSQSSSAPISRGDSGAGGHRR
jgi:hypothetical protein